MAIFAHIVSSISEIIGNRYAKMQARMQIKREAQYKRKRKRERERRQRMRNRDVLQPELFNSPMNTHVVYNDVTGAELSQNNNIIVALKDDDEILSDGTDIVLDDEHESSSNID